MKYLPALAIAFLALISLELLVPKILLVIYMNKELWAAIGWSDAFNISVQDFVPVVVVFAALVAFMRRPSPLRALVGLLVTGLLLGILLTDARVRELWLKPINLELIRYYWASREDLESGDEFFFRRDIGFGMTLRRVLIYIALLHMALWTLASLVLHLCCRRYEAMGYAYARPGRRFWIGAGAITFMLLVFSCFTPHYMYVAEANLFTKQVVAYFRTSGPTPAALAKAAETFEQKLRPAHEVLTRPRVQLEKVAPFKNVVLVFLESYRWRSCSLPGQAPFTPTLARLAREGMSGKSYVSMPHSCKSHFTVMTGWHPFLGLEIREAMRDRFDSFFWCLREHKNAKTYCFSAQNLAFENLDGILSSCGVDKRYGPGYLAKAAGYQGGAVSSFGSDDTILLEVPARILEEGGGPFAAVFIPLIAHYPYDFDGKTPQDGATLQSYRKSIAQGDRDLAVMLQNFEKRGLLKDTLFVLVGDHGESFGEHGTWVHNNSMYEEEVTAPIIFWSADGRLRDPTPLVARHIDIAETIADLCAVDDPNWRVQGVSLLRQHKPEAIFASSFFTDVSKTVIDGLDKHIVWPLSGDRIERYDLATDPFEQHPIAVTPEEKQKAVSRLQAFAAYQALIFEQEK